MKNNGRLYNLNHCTYRCEYHLVWTPKYRGHVMADKYIKAQLKRIIKMICTWKHVRIIAWHIGDDHIHLYLLIPPKYSVSYIVGLVKSKSSAWVKKTNGRIPQGSFWCVGYFATTIGINEFAIKTYIANQEKKMKDLPRLPL
jgi:putative transposase